MIAGVTQRVVMLRGPEHPKAFHAMLNGGSLCAGNGQFSLKQSSSLHSAQFTLSNIYRAAYNKITVPQDNTDKQAVMLSLKELAVW